MKAEFGIAFQINKVSNLFGVVSKETLGNTKRIFYDFKWLKILKERKEKFIFRFLTSAKIVEAFS